MRARGDPARQLTLIGRRFFAQRGGITYRPDGFDNYHSTQSSCHHTARPVHTSLEGGLSSCSRLGFSGSSPVQGLGPSRRSSHARSRGREPPSLDAPNGRGSAVAGAGVLAAGMVNLVAPSLARGSLAPGALATGAGVARRGRGPCLPGGQQSSAKCATWLRATKSGLVREPEIAKKGLALLRHSWRLLHLNRSQRREAGPAAFKNMLVLRQILG